MSSEGSRASRLTQERAEMLVTGLPSCTTRRLALVSFPGKTEGEGARVRAGWGGAVRWDGGSTNTWMQAWGLLTCGHVEEEGENTATVIACPEQPARGIEGQSEDPARQLAGATLHFLARGDVHDMHVVLGIPHLWVRPAHHHPAPSQSLLGSDHNGAAVNGTSWFVLESNPSWAVAGRPGGDQGLRSFIQSQPLLPSNQKSQLPLSQQPP